MLLLYFLCTGVAYLFFSAFYFNYCYMPKKVLHMCLHLAFEDAWTYNLGISFQGLDRFTVGENRGNVF